MYTQQEIIEKLIPIFEQYPIKRVALFGSYAKDEQTKDSDVDIVVELDTAKLALLNELPDIIYPIWDDVEETVKLKADLLTLDSVDSTPKIIRERILSEMRYFYEA